MVISAQVMMRMMNTWREGSRRGGEGGLFNQRWSEATGRSRHHAAPQAAL